MSIIIVIIVSIIFIKIPDPSLSWAPCPSQSQHHCSSGSKRQTQPTNQIVASGNSLKWSELELSTSKVCSQPSSLLSSNSPRTSLQSWRKKSETNLGGESVLPGKLKYLIIFHLSQDCFSIFLHLGPHQCIIFLHLDRDQFQGLRTHSALQSGSTDRWQEVSRDQRGWPDIKNWQFSSECWPISWTQC